MEYIMEQMGQMGQQQLEIETDMFNHFYDFEPPCIKKQHREAKRKEMEEAEMFSESTQMGQMGQMGQKRQKK